jgi:hypothetical protein
VAKALAANDYVRGPKLWEPESVDRRWAELDDDDIQHYVALANAAVVAFLDGAS